MYSREKEFIRDVFMSGRLDVVDFETLKRFCQIFEGETEAVIAVSHTLWLEDEPEKIAELVAIANPNTETMDAYNRWCEFAKKGAPQ